MNKKFALFLSLSALVSSASAFALDNPVLNVGSPIITKGLHEGRVTKVLGNGMVEVVTNSGLGPEIKSVNEVAKQDGGCRRSLPVPYCTGQTGITEGGNYVTIKGFFEADGTVVIRRPNGALEIKPAMAIGNASDGVQHGGFYMGQGVYTEHGNSGKIRGFMQDGSAMVSSTADPIPHKKPLSILRKSWFGSNEQPASERSAEATSADAAL